jgi:hypothetical protein
MYSMSFDVSTFEYGVPETDVYPGRYYHSSTHAEFLHGVHQLASMYKRIHEDAHGSNVEAHGKYHIIYGINC